MQKAVKKKGYSVKFQPQRHEGTKKLNVESTGDYSTILTKEAIRHINVRKVNLLENAIH